MKFSLSAIFLLFLLLQSCIGTDKIDVIDQEKAIQINLTPMSKGLMVGDDFTFTAQYLLNGMQESHSLIWESSDPSVASVDQNGTVTALKIGSTFISSGIDGVESNQAVVNVVATDTELASIEISSTTFMLPIGDSVLLTTEALSANNQSYVLQDTVWSVVPNNLAEITKDSYLSALNSGEVEITRSSEGVISNTLFITIEGGSMTRSGSFQGTSYNISGDVSLTAENGKILLSFQPNFTTQSGPGLVIYLSNDNGSDIVSKGKRIIDLPQNSGAFELDITDKISSINTYKYVIVHCEPFNVPFGYAELN